MKKTMKKHIHKCGVCGKLYDCPRNPELMSENSRVACPRQRRSICDACMEKFK